MALPLYPVMVLNCLFLRLLLRLKQPVAFEYIHLSFFQCSCLYSHIVPGHTIVSRIPTSL